SLLFLFIYYLSGQPQGLPLLSTSTWGAVTILNLRAISQYSIHTTQYSVTALNISLSPVAPPACSIEHPNAFIDRLRLPVMAYVTNTPPGLRKLTTWANVSSFHISG